MAQWRIEHSCGDAVTHQLYGKSADRAQRAGWLAQQPCMDHKRAAEMAEAATATADLPALVGSDKQIAWATTIRAKALAAVADTLAEWERMGRGQGVDEATLAAEIAKAIPLRDSLAGETGAKWWIDHRGESGRQLLKSRQQVTA